MGRPLVTVDPIDGTVNYVRGLPNFSVSIAVEVDDVVMVGVVYDPGADELFFATEVRAPRRNGMRIECSAVSTLSEALVGTGFSYVAARRARQAETLRAVLPAVADIRRPGSAALSLCWVAAGRLDAFYEHGLEPWDFAAGALIATESGARFESLDSEGDPPLRLAACPNVFHQLAALLIGDARSA